MPWIVGGVAASVALIVLVVILATGGADFSPTKFEEIEIGTREAVVEEQLGEPDDIYGDSMWVWNTDEGQYSVFVVNGEVADKNFP